MSELPITAFLLTTCVLFASELTTLVDTRQNLTATTDLSLSEQAQSHQVYGPSDFNQLARNSSLYSAFQEKAHTYVRFMQGFGEEGAELSRDRMGELFSADLKKEAMGKIVAQGLEGLECQLLGAKEHCGGFWEIKLLGDILVDTQNCVATIHFAFQGKTIEPHTTMARFYFENPQDGDLRNGLKINRIVEVFGKLDGAW